MNPIDESEALSCSRRQLSFLRAIEAVNPNMSTSIMYCLITLIISICITFHQPMASFQLRLLTARKCAAEGYLIPSARPPPEPDSTMQINFIYSHHISNTSYVVEFWHAFNNTFTPKWYTPTALQLWLLTAPKCATEDSRIHLPRPPPLPDPVISIEPLASRYLVLLNVGMSNKFALIGWPLSENGHGRLLLANFFVFFEIGSSRESYNPHTKLVHPWTCSTLYRRCGECTDLQLPLPALAAAHDEENCWNKLRLSVN